MNTVNQNQPTKQKPSQPKWTKMKTINQIKAVTSCSTHKIDQQETDG